MDNKQNAIQSEKIKTKVILDTNRKENHLFVDRRDSRFVVSVNTFEIVIKWEKLDKTLEFKLYIFRDC
jgi:hypothetical protein